MLLLILLAVAQGLDFTLEATSNTEPRLTFTLTNNAAEHLILCIFNSPLDTNSNTYRSNPFNIVHVSGLDAIYGGIYPRRIPTLSDLITLGPGQTINATLDLSEGYYFPLSGQYKITLDSTIYIFHGQLNPSLTPSALRDAFKQFQPCPLYQSLTLDVEQPNPMPVTTRVHRRPGTGPTQNCTDQTQIDHCTESAVNALNTTTGAKAYLGTKNCPALGAGTGYETWFGQCRDTNNKAWLTEVKSTINGIYNALNTDTYIMNCGGDLCQTGYYSYVIWTDEAHTIYLCDLFFQVTSAGCDLDNGPGTLTHELSHFFDIGSTYDYRYGVDACQKLAKNQPDKAVDNADSFAFFIESCYS